MSVEVPVVDCAELGALRATLHPDTEIGDLETVELMKLFPQLAHHAQTLNLLSYVLAETRFLSEHTLDRKQRLSSVAEEYCHDI